MQFSPVIPQTGPTVPAQSTPVSARDHADGRFGAEMRAAEPSRDQQPAQRGRQNETRIDREAAIASRHEPSAPPETQNNNRDRVRDKASDRHDPLSPVSATRPGTDPSDPVDPETAVPIPDEQIAMATPAQPPALAPVAVLPTALPAALIEAQATGPASSATMDDAAHGGKPAVENAETSLASPPTAPERGQSAVTQRVASGSVERLGNTTTSLFQTLDASMSPASGTPPVDLIGAHMGADILATDAAAMSARSSAIAEPASVVPPTTATTGQPTVSAPLQSATTVSVAEVSDAPVSNPTVSDAPVSDAPVSNATVSNATVWDNGPKKGVPAHSTNRAAKGGGVSKADLVPNSDGAEHQAVRSVDSAVHAVKPNLVRTTPEMKISVTSISNTTSMVPPGDGISIPQSTYGSSTAVAAHPSAVGNIGSTGAPTATAQFAHVTPPAVHQVAVQITRAVHDGTDRMTVQLRPAALGHVSIDLEIGHDNRLIAVIAADRADTLDLLQRDAKALERALNEAGIKADAGSLSFNLRGENGNRGFDRFAANGTIGVKGDMDRPDFGPETADTHPIQRPVALGGVDIRI